METLRHRPMAATLVEWHLLDLHDLTFGNLDAKLDPLVPDAERHQWMYGWGFSYVFTRATWEEHVFPDMHYMEDIEWMEGLLASEVPVALVRLPPSSSRFYNNTVGLCAHTAHVGSCTGGEWACLLLGPSDGSTEQQEVLVRVGAAVPPMKEFRQLVRFLQEQVLTTPAYKEKLEEAERCDPCRGLQRVGLRAKADFFRRANAAPPAPRASIGGAASAPRRPRGGALGDAPSRHGHPGVPAPDQVFQRRTRSSGLLNLGR